MLASGSASLDPPSWCRGPRQNASRLIPRCVLLCRIYGPIVLHCGIVIHSQAEGPASREHWGMVRSALMDHAKRSRSAWRGKEPRLWAGSRGEARGAAKLLASLVKSSTSGEPGALRRQARERQPPEDRIDQARAQSTHESWQPPACGLSRFEWRKSEFAQRDDEPSKNYK